MRLYTNLTSPFARIVRIALREKGLMAQVEEQMVDPWADVPEFLAANGAGRVPALLLPDGTALTESLLIVQWLEAAHPRPTLLGADAAHTLAAAGIAMGVIDAAATIIINRKTTTPEYDGLMVGRKRIRTITTGLGRLEAAPPAALHEGTLTLAAIACVVAVDYVRFRFADAAWLPGLPGLDAWMGGLGERGALVETRPG